MAESRSEDADFLAVLRAARNTDQAAKAAMSRLHEEHEKVGSQFRRTLEKILGSAGDPDDAPVLLEQVQRLGRFLGEADDPVRIASVGGGAHVCILPRLRSRVRLVAA